MNKAIDVVQRRMGVTIREFTVTGFPYEGRFAHRWYIGCDDCMPDAGEVRRILDETLREINDDYAVERDSALKEVFVEVLPDETFYDYLKHIGREGGMSKFPRVLKGRQREHWEAFLKEDAAL
jgi:hypothetical protein